MQIAELQAFIKAFKAQPLYQGILEGVKTEQELIYADGLKLSEEIGELNEQLLGKFHYQRKDKSDRFSDEKLGLEIADVILSAAMLADSLNFDLEELLKQKMTILREKAFKN